MGYIIKAKNILTKMTKITENSIEELAIERLQELGYDYVYAPDIAPDGERPERSSYDDVLLGGRLINKLQMGK